MGDKFRTEGTITPDGAAILREMWQMIGSDAEGAVGAMPSWYRDLTGVQIKGILAILVTPDAILLGRRRGVLAKKTEHERHEMATVGAVTGGHTEDSDHDWIVGLPLGDQVLEVFFDDGDAGERIFEAISSHTS